MATDLQERQPLPSSTENVIVYDSATHTASAYADHVSERRPLSISTAKGKRPSIARAATAFGFTRNNGTFTTPALSPSLGISSAGRRPSISRPATATAALTGHPEEYNLLDDGTMAASENGQTTLLSRAANLLDLHPPTSYTHLNAPPPPANWDDNQHRRSLIRVYDAVCEQGPKLSTDRKVSSTQKSMIYHFPDLAEGAGGLSREWTEYVLGVALRHPFCTAEKMGRWEVLAASGGARGTWGPW